MCGKFTQMFTWGELHHLLGLTGEAPPGNAEDGPTTSTPMRTANILHLNDDGERVMTKMRWGFSKAGSPSPRPDHMHACAETIDTRPTFRESFERRRGLCFVRTFNEGEEVGKKTVQWTITPKDGKLIPIAVIYELWVNGDERLYTFVQVTTAANALISKITDRMPAIIPEDHWPLWLGEDRAPLAEVKAILQPFDDGGGWDMAPEPKKPRKPRA